MFQLYTFFVFPVFGEFSQFFPSSVLFWLNTEKATRRKYMTEVTFNLADHLIIRHDITQPCRTEGFHFGNSPHLMS